MKKQRNYDKMAAHYRPIFKIYDAITGCKVVRPEPMKLVGQMIDDIGKAVGKVIDELID